MGHTLPFFAISLALHKGLASLAADQASEARQWFATSARLGWEATRINPFFFVEGIQHLWQAEEYLLRMDVRQGALEQALATLERITSATDRKHPGFRGVQPPSRLLTDATLSVLPPLLEAVQTPRLQRYSACLEQVAAARHRRQHEHTLFSELQKGLEDSGQLSAQRPLPDSKALAATLHGRLARIPKENPVTASPEFKQTLDWLAAKAGTVYRPTMGWGGWS